LRDRRHAPCVLAPPLEYPETLAGACSRVQLGLGDEENARQGNAAGVPRPPRRSARGPGAVVNAARGAARGPPIILGGSRSGGSPGPATPPRLPPPPPI